MLLAPSRADSAVGHRGLFDTHKRARFREATRSRCICMFDVPFTNPDSGMSVPLNVTISVMSYH